MPPTILLLGVLTACGGGGVGSDAGGDLPALESPSRGTGFFPDVRRVWPPLAANPPAPPAPPPGPPPAPPPTPPPPAPTPAPASAEILDLVVLPGSSDGAVKLRFTVPVPSTQADAVGYDVRAQVRHITPENVLSAPTVTTSQTPAATGTLDYVSLSGLEEAQTYQFAVRVKYAGGEYGAWSLAGWGVSGTVPGDNLAAVPANAIHLSQSDFPNGATYTVTKAGYYVLDGDVTTTGPGIAVSAAPVTLDLGGHTLTFNTSGAGGSSKAYPVAGVAGGAMTIVNGTIVQGGTSSYDVVSGGITAYDSTRTYGVERQGVRLTVSAGQGSIEATIDALASALNASTDPHWTPITWSRTGSGASSKLVGTHDTASTPFFWHGYTSGTTSLWEWPASKTYGNHNQAIYSTWGGTICRRLTIKVYGADCIGIYHDDRRIVTVDHCTVYNHGAIGNRHQGWSGIETNGNHESLDGGHSIHHCTVVAGHMGIRPRLVAEASDPFLVHHNVVTGLGGVGTNDYGLCAHATYSEVFDNLVSGPRRGIHVDHADNWGSYVRVHDNEIRVENEDNDEYGGGYDVHGIKLEFSEHSEIFRNLVVVNTESGTGADQHAHAFDFSGYDPVQETNASAGTIVYHNLFVAIAPSTSRAAFGLYYPFPKGVSTPWFYENVVRASTAFFGTEWPNYDRQVGDPFRDCVFEAEGSSAFGIFAEISAGAGSYKGLEVWDPVTTTDVTSVAVTPATPKDFDFTVRYTLTVRALDASEQPIVGATVTVSDSGGTTQFTGTTDAAGLASGLVRRYVMDKPASLPYSPARKNDYGPFTVTVSSGGSTYSGSHVVSGTACLVVHPSATTASFDTAAPEAVSNLRSAVRTPTSVLLLWEAASDASGIRMYRVYDEAQLLAVCEGTQFAVFGRTPGSKGKFAVRAVDLGGNEGPATWTAEVTMPADDRGNLAPIAPSGN